MATFTKEDVQKVATLAKLPLTEEEASNYAGYFADALAYFAVLQEVDTEGIDPLSQTTDITMTVEADAVKTELCTPEELLDCSQRPVAYRQIKVPPVL